MRPRSANASASCLSLASLAAGAAGLLAAAGGGAASSTGASSVSMDSPGGSVTAGLAIYDTMQFVRCPIATYCIGQAASMGAVLLAAGTKGKRHTLPNSRIMIHQPWGGVGGTALDISIQADEILRLKDTLNGILAKHSGKSIEEVQKDSDRDFFMGGQEAKDYGLIDEIVETAK